MFYSNVLSVRRILLEIKKKPDQWDCSGEGTGAQGTKRCKKTNKFEGAEKKRVPTGGVWSPTRALRFC